jgi:hypothetical protein
VALVTAASYGIPKWDAFKLREFVILGAGIVACPVVAIFAIRKHPQWFSLRLIPFAAILFLFAYVGIAWQVYYDPPFRDFFSIPFYPEFLRGSVPLTSFLLFFILILPIQTQKTASTRTALYCTMVGFLLFFQFSWRLAGISTSNDGGGHTAELEPVIQNLVQAFHHKIPLVDYTSAYGYYDLFLAPVFRTIGFTQFHVTLVMATLQMISILSLMAVFSRWIQSHLLFVLGSVALSYSASGWRLLKIGGAPYFQYYPIRFLFPALFVPLISRWITRPTLKLTLIITGFSVLLLLWNLESGVAVFGAWVVCLIWMGPALCRATSQASISQHLQWGLISAFTSITVLFIAYFYQGGSLSYLPLIFGYQHSALGKNELMGYVDLSHRFWMFVCLTYGFGIFSGIASRFGKLNLQTGSFLFTLSALGFGLFTYFFGRSHYSTLSVSLWPWTFIVFIIGDKVITLIRNKEFPLLPGALVATPVIAIGLILSITHWQGVNWVFGMLQSQFLHSYCKPSTTNGETAEYIRRSVVPNRSVFIYSIHSWAYYLEAGIKPYIQTPTFMEPVGGRTVETVRHHFRSMPPTDLFVDAKRIESFLSFLGISKLESYVKKDQSPDGSILHFVFKSPD